MEGVGRVVRPQRMAPVVMAGFPRLLLCQHVEFGADYRFGSNGG